MKHLCYFFYYSIYLTIYYSFFSIFLFIFLMPFIKNNFVKQLIISISHTKLIIFFIRVKCLKRHTILTEEVLKMENATMHDKFYF